jgi:hypothetical protein
VWNVVSHIEGETFSEGVSGNRVLRVVVGIGFWGRNSGLRETR